MKKSDKKKKKVDSKKSGKKKKNVDSQKSEKKKNAGSKKSEKKKKKKNVDSKKSEKKKKKLNSKKAEKKKKKLDSKKSEKKKKKLNYKKAEKKKKKLDSKKSEKKKKKVESKKSEKKKKKLDSKKAEKKKATSDSPGSSKSKCLTFGRFENISQSCYIDSVLFSLLAVPNEFINKYILRNDLKNLKDIVVPKSTIQNIQKILNEYQAKIFENKSQIFNCKKIMDVMKGIKLGGYDMGADGKQYDAGEFLLFLLRLFELDVVTVQTTNYGTMSKDSTVPFREMVETSRQRTNNGLIHMVPRDLLRASEPNVELEDFLNKVDWGREFESGYTASDGRHYPRRIMTSEVIHAPYLVFLVQRDYHNKIIKKPVNPTKTINFPSKATLSLSAIVEYNGDIKRGHYVCYFVCDDNWYKYDDMGPSITHVGKYEDMLTKNPTVKHSGVLYFYS